MALAQHPDTAQTCRFPLRCLRPAAHLRMPMRRLATGDGSLTVQRLIQLMVCCHPRAGHYLVLTAH